MPRPKSPHPRVKLHVSLRQETLAKLKIRFFSQDHAYGFPQGAISSFVESAIEEKLERIHNAEAADKALP